MKFASLYRLSSIALALGGLACNSSPAQPVEAPALATEQVVEPQPVAAVDPVAHGKTLITLGGCSDCHTPMKFDPKLGMPVPDLARFMSGHPVGAPDPTSTPGQGDQAVIGPTFTSFKLPFGVVYAANLTPDRETGIGAWTPEQFVATLRTGHRKGDGRAILPPMPWQNLQHQSEADLRAMFAYLSSLPPIDNEVPAPGVPAEVIAQFAALSSGQAQAADHAAKKRAAL